MRRISFNMTPETPQVWFVTQKQQHTERSEQLRFPDFNRGKVIRCPCFYDDYVLHPVTQQFLTLNKNQKDEIIKIMTKDERNHGTVTELLVPISQTCSF